MALSILSLLVPQSPVDGALAGGKGNDIGQHSPQDKQAAFAHWLSRNPAAQQALASNEALPELPEHIHSMIGAVQALQQMIKAVEALPQDASTQELKAVVENIAELEALPEQVQARLLEAIEDGTIATPQEMELVLRQVRKQVVQAIPAVVVEQLPAIQKMKKSDDRAIDAAQASELVADTHAVTAQQDTQDKAAKENDAQANATLNVDAAEQVVEDLVVAVMDATAAPTNLDAATVHAETDVALVLDPQAKGAAASHPLAQKEAGKALAQGAQHAADESKAGSVPGAEQASIAKGGTTPAADELAVAADDDMTLTAKEVEALAAVSTNTKVEKLDPTEQKRKEGKAANVLEQILQRAPQAAHAGLEKAVQAALKTETTVSVTPSADESSAVQAGVNVAQTSSVEAKTSLQHLEQVQANLKEGHTAQQVLAKLTVKPHRNHNEYSIQLDPAELGRVEVIMKIDDKGEVRLQVVAETRHALDALQRDARFLEKGMEEAGLKLDADGMQFDLKEQGNGQFANDQGEQGQGAVGATGAAGNDEANEPTLSSTETIHYQITQADGLDIRV